MKVTLIDITNTPITQIYRAYRICYSDDYPTEIDVNKSNEEMGEFIKPLMELGHTTPLEQVSISFAIEDVSRALTHQLVRHRTGKFNQQSQRYVRLGEFKYVVPPAIKDNKYAKGIFLKTMSDIQKAYDGISFLLEQGYLEQGLSNRESKTRAIEDARYVFPNACCTNIIVTMDLSNFRKFLGLRMCVDSQWEIRHLASEMRDLVKDFIPFVDHKVMNCGKGCNKCFEKGVK